VSNRSKTCAYSITSPAKSMQGSGPRASQLKTADIPSPLIVPSARPADAADIRATLPVGVESAVRSSIAVAGAPFALSMGTALRQEQSGGRKDGRDN
jgi:hypothetical protein